MSAMMDELVDVEQHMARSNLGEVAYNSEKMFLWCVIMNKDVRIFGSQFNWN